MRNRDRIRKSLQETAWFLDRSEYKVRTYEFKNKVIEGELAINVLFDEPGQARSFLIELGSSALDQKWPKHTWFSVFFLGSFDAGEGPYPRTRAGMDVIETYPSRDQRASTFVTAAAISDNLLDDQKIAVIGLRVYVQKKKPDRKWST